MSEINLRVNGKFGDKVRSFVYGIDKKIPFLKEKIIVSDNEAKYNDFLREQVNSLFVQIEVLINNETDSTSIKILEKIKSKLGNLKKDITELGATQMVTAFLLLSTFINFFRETAEFYEAIPTIESNIVLDSIIKTFLILVNLKFANRIRFHISRNRYQKILDELNYEQ